jgi:hypothetical protein
MISWERRLGISAGGRKTVRICCRETTLTHCAAGRVRARDHGGRRGPEALPRRLRVALRPAERPALLPAGVLVNQRWACAGLATPPHLFDRRSRPTPDEAVEREREHTELRCAPSSKAHCDTEATRPWILPSGGSPRRRHCVLCAGRALHPAPIWPRGARSLRALSTWRRRALALSISWRPAPP